MNFKFSTNKQNSKLNFNELLKTSKNSLVYERRIQGVPKKCQKIRSKGNREFYLLDYKMGSVGIFIVPILSVMSIISKNQQKGTVHPFVDLTYVNWLLDSLSPSTKKTRVRKRKSDENILIFEDTTLRKGMIFLEKEKKNVFEAIEEN